MSILLKIDVMNSMKEHWEGLTLFVEHPDVPMDNNSLERMLLAYGPGQKKLVFYNTDLPQA